MLVGVTFIRPEAAAASRPGSGYIRVGREPGGRVGDWTRTALLSNEPGESNISAQLHEVRLHAWEGSWITLTGLEREWRRRSCTEYQAVWRIAARDLALVEVFKLREQGERLPLDVVCQSTPMRG